MYEVGWIIGAIARGWYYKVGNVHPENRIVQPLDSPEFEGALEQLVMYAIDIEARAIRYRQQYEHQGVHIVEVRLEELQSPISILQFFQKLGLYLDYRSFYAKAVRGLKTNRLAKYRFSTTMEEAESAVERVLAQYKTENKTIPALPHLKTAVDPWIPEL